MTECKTCGNEMEFLGFEDDGMPIFRCNYCNEIKPVILSEHERIVEGARLLNRMEIER